MISLEETKELLNELKYARKRAIQLKAALAEIENDCMPLRSSWPDPDKPCVQGSSGSSPVERMQELMAKANIRIQAAKGRYLSQLEAVYKLEDTIAKALEGLTYEEQNVIVDFYQRDRTHYQIAMDYGWSNSTIIRRKNQAIRKIMRRL